MKKVLSFFVLLVFISSVQKLNAQAVFNHLTIYVVDLKTSADFYRNVFHFQEIPEPFHDNKHVWMRIGKDHGNLHIVSGAKQKEPHDINIHLAFNVPSVEDFSKHLDSLHIKYGNWNQSSKEPQVRPDGIKQIYLQDPDGYWLEVNNDEN